MIMGKGMHWMSKTLGRNLLLARLKQAGPAGRGEAAAARRRAEEFGREERGRRKRTAHWLLHTRGYWVLQRGQFINMKIFPADYYLPQAAIFSLNYISINFS